MNSGRDSIGKFKPVVNIDREADNGAHPQEDLKNMGARPIRKACPTLEK